MPIGKALARLRHNLFARDDATTAARGDATASAGELAWADGLFFGRVPLERWNPDELIWQRGYGVYRRMLHDDQVRALVDLKRAMITSRGWHFIPGGEGGAQTRCIALFRYALLQHLQGTFTQVLGDLLTSQVYGFSLLEQVIVPVPWEGRTHWLPRALKLRPAESFTFETDAHGNLTALHQLQEGRKVALPPEKFLHHVNRPEVHAQYGESDLRACHRHWWAKDNQISKRGNVRLLDNGDGTLDAFIARTSVGYRTDRYRNYEPTEIP